MKYALLALTLLSFNAFSAVVKSNDAERGCTLFQSVTAEENGNVILQPGQVLVSSKNTYGLSFTDMEIDFDRREVRVQPMINIVLGFNRMLTPAKAIIRQDNPEFSFLINQLNRKISLFEKICINSSNEIEYAKFFPAPEQK